MSKAEQVSQLMAKTPLREVGTNVAPRRGFACVLPMGQSLPVVSEPRLHTRKELMQEDSHTKSTSVNSSSCSSGRAEASGDEHEQLSTTTPRSVRSSNCSTTAASATPANDLDRVVLSPDELRGVGPVTPERPTNAGELFFFRTARSLAVPAGLVSPKAGDDEASQEEKPTQAAAEKKSEQVESAPLVQKTPSKPIEVSVRRPQQLRIASNAAPAQMEVLFEEHCSERFFTSSESSPTGGSAPLTAKDPSPLAVRKTATAAAIPPLLVESIATPDVAEPATTPMAGMVLKTASTKRTLSPLKKGNGKVTGEHTAASAVRETTPMSPLIDASAETLVTQKDGDQVNVDENTKEKKKKRSLKACLMNPVYPTRKLSVPPPPAPRPTSQTASPRGEVAIAAATTLSTTTATNNNNKNKNDKSDFNLNLRCTTMSDAEKLKLERYARELSPSDCRQVMRAAVTTPIKCDTHMAPTPSPEPHKYTRTVSNDTAARGTSSSNGCSTGRTPERSEGFSSVEKEDDTVDVHNIYIIDHPLAQAEKNATALRARSRDLEAESAKLQEQLLADHACYLIQLSEQMHTEWNDMLLRYHVATRSPLSAQQLELSNSSLHTLPVSKAEKATNSPRSYFPEHISCKFQETNKVLPVPTTMTLLFHLHATATPSEGDVLLQTYYRRKEELHELAVKHALFDTMYLYMVAIPAFRMVELQSRRLICMRRDLYVRSRIELFMSASPANHPSGKREMLLGPLRLASSAVAGKPMPNSTQRLLASMGIKMERRSSSMSKRSAASEAPAKSRQETAAAAVPLQAEEFVHPSPAADLDVQPRPYVCLPTPCARGGAEEEVPEPPPLAAIVIEQTKAHQVEQQASEGRGSDDLRQQDSGAFASPPISPPLSSNESQAAKHQTPLQRLFEGGNLSRHSSKRTSACGSPNYPPHLSLNARRTAEREETEEAASTQSPKSPRNVTRRSHEGSLLLYFSKKHEHRKRSEKEKKTNTSTPSKRKYTSYYEKFKHLKFRMEDDRKNRLRKEPTTTPTKKPKRPAKEEEDEETKAERRLTEGRVAALHEEAYQGSSRSASTSRRLSSSATAALVSAANALGSDSNDHSNSNDTHTHKDTNNTDEDDNTSEKGSSRRLFKNNSITKQEWWRANNKDENGMALPTIKMLFNKPRSDHRVYTRVVKNSKGKPIGLRAKERKDPKERKRSPKPSPTESMFVDLEDCEER